MAQQKTSYTNHISPRVATRLLGFLSHLTTQQNGVNENPKEKNQKHLLEETLNAQKEKLLSYYNSNEEPSMKLYHYPSSFQLQTDLSTNAEPTETIESMFSDDLTFEEELQGLISKNEHWGAKSILLDRATLEKIIENPLILKDYWWKYESIGPLFPGYPLEVACKKGWNEMVLHLINEKHLIPISKGRSLCNAIEQDHHEIVQILIQAGVSVTECSIRENRIIHSDGSLRNPNPSGHLTSDSLPECCPLHYAIKNNAIKSAALLLESGASLDDLSFVHPIKTDRKEQQQSVRQLIDEGKLTITIEMQNLINAYSPDKKCKL